jgi:ABC-2 type transport system permease protein
VSFCISSFGIVLATFYDSYESFSVIMNFIIMPMFFLSGAMYPVRLLPNILGIVAKLNPLTYGIDAIKHAIFPYETGHMGPDFSIMTSTTVIILTSIVFVLIAGKAFERKG